MINFNLKYPFVQLRKHNTSLLLWNRHRPNPHIARDSYCSNDNRFHRGGTYLYCGPCVFLGHQHLCCCTALESKEFVFSFKYSLIFMFVSIVDQYMQQIFSFLFQICIRFLVLDWLEWCLWFSANSLKSPPGIYIIDVNEV